MKWVDVAIANEEDCQNALGMSAASDVESGALDASQYKVLAEKVLSAYPTLKKIAITLRESRSANDNGWSGVLHTRTEFLVSRRYDIHHIVDRVGSGDAFRQGSSTGCPTWPRRRRRWSLPLPAPA